MAVQVACQFVRKRMAMAMVQGMAKMQEQQNRMFESSGMSAAASHESFHSRAEFMPTLTNGSRADVVQVLACGRPVLNHASCIISFTAAGNYWLVGSF